MPNSQNCVEHVIITRVNKLTVPASVAALVLGSFAPASADYTIVLNNGRRITVPSYREENGLIKFQGFGGEIGISKDQIQEIREARQEERPALTSPQSSSSTAPLTRPTPTEAKRPPPRLNEDKVPSPDQRLAEQKAKEEKEYQQRLKDLTARIVELRQRYAVETVGNTGPEPIEFTTDEAFRRHQEDLISRLRDAQYRAQGLPTGSAAQQPPMSLSAPPRYTQKQKELSDLRNQLDQLEGERKRLVEEMKQKNFDIGSLFIE
jgi:hypothetical protein